METDNVQALLACYYDSFKSLIKQEIQENKENKMEVQWNIKYGKNTVNVQIYSFEDYPLNFVTNFHLYIFLSLAFLNLYERLQSVDFISNSMLVMFLVFSFKYIKNYIYLLLHLSFILHLQFILWDFCIRVPDRY